MVASKAETLPTGTISFLFTDIEGSTRHVAALGDDWVPVLQRHNQILLDAVSANGGFPIKTEGDSLFAVFSSALGAVETAVVSQRHLASEKWPSEHEVRVRMGVHTGIATLLGSDYVGLEVHRAARISDAAHGGQIVISESTVIGSEAALPDGVTLEDLGKFRLKDLSDPETLFQVRVEGLKSDFPALRTLDAIPNNLPAQLTTFVGREEEVNAGLELLERTQVLTLTGPGGTGKTRLSLQIAAELSHRFEDGVFFVDLSPVSDVAVVPSVVLNAIGMSASGQDQSPEERLLAQMSTKSVLMVLDNFEHLLEAGAVVVGMVGASPRSKFLVTSRAPLRIRGEQEMPIPPLETTPARTIEDALEMEGARLFVERATAIRPDFIITPDNLAAVNELVERLDGLPLAIELVASRLRLLPVEQILQRLDAQMLTSGSMDLPERQRTITNAIDWSYGLLGPAEQALFRRLSVFSGGARLEEIEALGSYWEPGGHPLHSLETLVEHSLLRTTPGAGGATRFRMLHVVREFAADRLGESDGAYETHKAHLEVFTSHVEKAIPEFLGKDRQRWLDLVEDDHDNIRTALEWGIANSETDVVMRLSSATWRFWQARGHLHEASRRLTTILEMEGGDGRYRAKALEALGGIFWWTGDFQQCEEIYGETVDMWRSIGDEMELANALYNHALAVGFGDFNSKKAMALFEEAREIYTRFGDPGGLGNVAWGIGNIMLERSRVGKVPEAEVLRIFEESTAYYREAGNQFGEGWSTFEIGAYYVRVGQWAGAWDYLSDAASLFWSHRDLSGVVLTVSELAGVALGMGDKERAYRLAGMVESLRERTGTDLVVAEFNVIDGLDPRSLQNLEGFFLAAFNEGRVSEVDDIVAYALAGPTDDPE